MFLFDQHFLTPWERGLRLLSTSLPSPPLPVSQVQTLQLLPTYPLQFAWKHNLVTEFASIEGEVSWLFLRGTNESRCLSIMERALQSSRPAPPKNPTHVPPTAQPPSLGKRFSPTLPPSHILISYVWYHQPFLVGIWVPRFFLLHSTLQIPANHPSLNGTLIHTAMLKTPPWLPIA